jgi:hypothetical protein
MSSVYSSKELQAMAGITGRQMDSWHRRGWLPSLERNGVGSGVPIDWPEDTVRKAVLMGRLLSAGFNLERAHSLAMQFLSRPTAADIHDIVIGNGIRVTIQESSL